MQAQGQRCQGLLLVVGALSCQLWPRAEGQPRPVGLPLPPPLLQSLLLPVLLLLYQHPSE